MQLERAEMRSGRRTRDKHNTETRRHGAKTQSDLRAGHSPALIAGTRAPSKTALALERRFDLCSCVGDRGFAAQVACNVCDGGLPSPLLRVSVSGLVPRPP